MSSTPTENPDAVLAAWLALEVLSPQAIPRPQEVEHGQQYVPFENGQVEPWLDPAYQRGQGETAVYWLLYLGELGIARATNAMLERFPDNADGERRPPRGNCALGAVLLNGAGLPLEGARNFFLSSFAWGYGQIRSGNLRNLDCFKDEEARIATELERRLFVRDEEGNQDLVNAQRVQEVSDWLVNELNLPAGAVQPPHIAIRIARRGHNPQPPEMELLNSFFLSDLTAVRKAFRDREVGAALAAYMGSSPRRGRQDLVAQPELLPELVGADRLPLTRWPGRGRHPLALMQQAAINHAVQELEEEGMVAINGPPGTGKTTLLRDVVAKVVLDRAIVLADFDDPQVAFRQAEKVDIGQAQIGVHPLDERLLDHEILVASSNNKAVENISHALPEIDQIAEDLRAEARHFRTISDTIAARGGPIAEDATWGMAAAVLGNAKNCQDFSNGFYWHRARGIQRYLNAVAGVALQPLENDEAGVDVVKAENPPIGHDRALARWQDARRAFREALKNARALQKKAMRAQAAVARRAEAQGRADSASAALQKARNAYASAREKLEQSEHALEEATKIEQAAAEERKILDRMRPGFFARLCGSAACREWHHDMVVAQKALGIARADAKDADKAHKQALRDFSATKDSLDACERERKEADQELAPILATIKDFREKMGDNFADDDFWTQDADHVQTKSPWIFEEWQNARDELFVKAFELHRAFIDAAAGRLKRNLSAAMDVIKGRLEQMPPHLLRSVWASFFLVVPVVSTTFASFGRLFRPLGKEQLGWLLIDEAGQASPQAAVGAIWRSKRVVVIGDPFQIQPVVSVSPSLVSAVCGEFNVAADVWAPPQVSVQTIADRESWLGAKIGAQDEQTWVGVPLRVHRRCENPMFRISNQVAYGGLMVHATPAGASDIGAVLGESCWWDYPGPYAEGKWAEAEGEICVAALQELLENGIDNPDIFFITPFRAVAIELRRMMLHDDALRHRLVEPHNWVPDRVGTIHTFQGKEADSVVMVLGAPDDRLIGTRNWAGSPPNLLNVAVTRARRRLYVIGRHEVWRHAGAFCVPAGELPKKIWGNDA